MGLYCEFYIAPARGEATFSASKHEIWLCWLSNGLSWVRFNCSFGEIPSISASSVVWISLSWTLVESLVHFYFLGPEGLQELSFGFKENFDWALYLSISCSCQIWQTPCTWITFATVSLLLHTIIKNCPFRMAFFLGPSLDPQPPADASQTNVCREKASVINCANPW